MRAFLVPFALAYVATALLPSAAAHLSRPRGFAEVIRQHVIVPRGWALPTALGVSALELMLGGAAVTLLVGSVPSRWAATLLAVAAALGAAFALYVRRLIQTATADTPCGCSPFSSRLTSASYLPGLGLLGAAFCGWASAASGAPPPGAAGGSVAALLPALWGMTLAAGVAMVPATVPGAVGAEA